MNKYELQYNYNKNLNRYFDTKYINLNHSNTKKLIKQFNLLQKKEKKRGKKKIIKLKKINIKEYLSDDTIFRKKILKIYEYLKKNNMNKYFKYFLIHGSLASLDYIKEWSDVDTFVVIKNSVLKRFIILVFIFKVCYQKAF